MLRWTVLSICCLVFVTNSVLANIYVWEGDPSHCTISDINNTIQINVAGTYGFRAWNPETEALEDIQNIWIDSGVAGPVTLMIAYDENGGNGAVRLRQGNLTVDGYEVYLDGLEISGSIATHGDFDCDNITGTVDIDENIGEGVATRRFFVRNATAPIIVHGRLLAYKRLEAETLDDVTIGSHPTQGDIKIKNDYAGTLTIYPNMYGDVRIGERDEEGNVTTASDLTGTLDFRASLLGEVDITRDIATDEGVSGRILLGYHLNGGTIGIGGSVAQTDPNEPAIHIGGSVTDNPGGQPEPPMIKVGGQLGGVIGIGGLLDDSRNGPDIEVGSIDLEGLGAIAIDYDGYHAAHRWDPDAVIKVGTTEYTENNPGARVYEITECKGDLDNDRDLDSDDQDALDLTVAQYAAAYPGLLGSRYYHGDVNCDDQVDAEDVDALDWLVNEGCAGCMEGCQFDACYADLNENGQVDLADLAQLLAHYGMTSGATRDDGDIEGDDGDVDLADLAEMLRVYGGECGCFQGGRGAGGEGRSTISVYVEAYDTGGYSGGGFKGEVDHFVFDLKIELSDPNDDWVATGAELDRYNDATFRLSTTATTPDQYATFVAAPWTSLPQSATASVAGAYDPPDPTSEFTTTGINLAWYDTADSNDGPATIMRIVIDVSGVEGADVSEGFGSVYFSTSGPAEQEDILVADLVSETGTADSAPGLKWLSGEFYVNGKE